MPSPPSSTTNYAYWAAYLDYVIESQTVNKNSDDDDEGQPAGVGSPPYSRGTLPPTQNADRIDRFNNPNTTTYPTANNSLPRGFRNKVGYRTYVAFLMDHGRDVQLSPASTRPISGTKRWRIARPFSSRTGGRH